MAKYKIMAKKQRLQLILEKEDGKLWGRVSVDGNLLFDSATSLLALEKKLKKALKDFEGLEDVQFEYAYDLTSFFEEYSFLNQSKIAELAGINPSLLRQYSSGHKQPSKVQLGKIEKAIRVLAEKLKSVQLSTKAYAQ
jgi:DNA-binding transcriptional regulator YdaS (Cro superfamily)